MLWRQRLIKPKERENDMSKKHTPGPWIVSEIGSVHGSDGKAILSGGEYVGGESYANARLIAAAPELLEQLKLVRAYLTAKEITWTGIDAAIAKAEGSGK
jgi:hypothetical protein